jgi:hypothetical protein
LWVMFSSFLWLNKDTASLIGVSDHKCIFIQLSITHNKLNVNVFWRLVSALRSSHHQATTQEQKTLQVMEGDFPLHIRNTL